MCLYEKRYLHPDVVIGTREMPIPVETQTGSYLIVALLVRLPDCLEHRHSFRPHQRGQAGWAIDPTGHALLDVDCVAEHNFLSDLAFQHRQSPLSRSRPVDP